MDINKSEEWESTALMSTKGFINCIRCFTHIGHVASNDRMIYESLIRNGRRLFSGSILNFLLRHWEKYEKRRQETNP
jgi:hypothetical protein